MHATLKAVHVIALSLLLGGALFWLWVWSAVAVEAPAHLTVRMWRRVRAGMYLGAVCLLASGTLDLIRAASQVLEPVTLTSLWSFLIGTRYGQMTLLKSVCTPLVCASYTLLSSYRLCGQISITLSSVLLLTSFGFTSHAAAKADAVAILSHIVHLFGALTWGGGLVYLAALPWSALRQAPEGYGRIVWRLVERFSTVALVAVCLVGLSGTILAFLHIYGLVALAETPYGRVLTLKLLLMGLALGTAGWQVLRLRPALRRQARTCVPAVAARVLARCGCLVRIEALPLLGALGLAGFLTTLPPAERPAQVTVQQWSATVDTWRLQLTLTPVGDRGRVQGDLRLAQMDEPPPPATQSWLHLRMREHEMGTQRQAATRVALGHYTTTATISMAGSWEVEVSFQTPGEPVRVVTWPFEAATGSLDQDRTRRLELAAVLGSPLATLSSVLGVLLGGLASVTLWASRTGKLPGWALPLGGSLGATGALLVLRVILVDAYPTTYHANPLPPAPALLAQAQTLFHQHCTACHGATGQGDGPAAAALSPQPADLTAAHVDDHTDGDLFWWLTHGIPGTAMPAWEAQLTETERWMLVQYLRRLRQARPAR